MPCPSRFVLLLALALTATLTAAPVITLAPGPEVAHAAKGKGKGKKAKGKKKGGKKKTRCPKATVRLTTGGKVKCVKPKAVKPIKSKKSAGLRNAELMVGGVKLPPIKLVHKGKNYGTYRGPLSKSAQKRLLKAIATTEKQVEAGMMAQIQKLPATEERAAASAPGASARATIELENVGGLDKFKMEFNEQTGDWSTTGSAKAEVKLDNGASATVEVTAKTEGNSNVSLGEPDAEIGISIETSEGTSVTGMSFKMKIPPVTSSSSSNQSCPGADGKVKHDTSLKGVETGTYVADRVGKLEIDSVASTFSISGGVKSDYTMTENAQLPARLPFKTNIKFSYAAVAKILGIKVQNIRVTATGTASGAVDSKTGAVAPGADMDVKVNASGIAQSKVQNPMTSAALSLMRSEIGKLHTDAKKLEKKALQGDCTKIVFSPKSYTKEMAKGDTLSVEAKLETREGGKTAHEPVRMVAVAHAGSVKHNEGARANPAKMTVTAGEEKPSPAEVRVSLISRAGISRATWNASEAEFPKRYSGPISYQYAYTPVPGGVTDHMSGKATVTYELMSTQSNPDGSVWGRYEGVSANLSEIGYAKVAGDCTFSLKPNPRPPVSQELRFADLEIMISPTGQWSSGLVLDIDPGDMPAELICEDMVVSSTTGPHFVFNSRLPSIPGLRPMDPAGPIAGSGVTDIQVTMQPGFTANASWSLQPQK